MSLNDLVICGLTATIRFVKAYSSGFAYAKNQKEREEIKKRFLTNLYQAKIPLRKKQRNYPREIKYPRERYPKAGTVKNCER